MINVIPRRQYLLHISVLVVVVAKGAVQDERTIQMTYTIIIPEWAVFWFLAILTSAFVFVVVVALLPPPKREFKKG